MKIKRFFAKDMRAALTQVKEELGADAVIMSNKKVTGGVEIVAALDSEDPRGQLSSAASKTREELAERLDSAKRQLADDKVQLQSPSSRFAKVLNNFTGQSGDAEQGSGQGNEADSLSALLQRQSKHYGDEPRYGRHDEPQQSASPSYGERRYAAGGGRAQESQRRQPESYFNDPAARQTPSRHSSHQAGRQQAGHQQSRHQLDIGDYRRPAVPQAEPLHASRSAGPAESQLESHRSESRFGAPKPPKNRLDPSRYDPKARNHSTGEIDAMRNEMASIRRLLEHQVSGLMWQEMERREPMRAMMIKRLEKMGLSQELADQLACYIPEDVPANDAWPALLNLLSDQIITTKDSILESGGVVALLGPTGVGKTTTIAKLAARAAMEFGPDQIAMVTTDTFRIGAHEQLATYGRIMGCPVRVAKDAEELADILHQLRHRRLVLLDTAGMGQRDIRLSEQLDTLMQNSGSQIRSYLVLPSTAQRRVLHETIEHFRRIPLSGCVLTKLDESLSLGEVISVSIQHALPIAYLADGQRVPEDIKVATGNYLVARANELLEQELSQQTHFWSSESAENQGADFYD
ncbi:flagellar biosynthesis protein FlhF [Photobacterium sp. ZSDE20]|uniref:Flagellar biosynthesis protein FlhF n=1 Tax=Photobacterium pectinilyticum TaxID=2906793 RepID=A0ABT1N0R2_9GAMM|nr:flagellar biosynthesis protein FlhF [Photobacterium sp. ZSDE20]MCQ1058318.1 flagellar biosynthesis protein FlhF [Photobacterium sp. ZSDE20]MDD1823113.1 flagellar biosynthesis protein FlhF [Photobacterium sp. ZSDE20]